MGDPRAMRQHLSTLIISTPGEGFTDISQAINDRIASSGIGSGLATLHVMHTSCSLTINENADPRVLSDLAAYLRALVPVEGVRPISGQGSLRPYRHDDEGADDMPAHIRTALTSTTLSLSIQRGCLALGTWQAVYLWEHRSAAQRRQIGVHLLGE
ncbi:MAG: secondary thiamine-phosphate synthase enzyme YjbQ [Cyanobacteriota bacterium]|nr:secondary thiamine-phosphate synthase enzyme YjbQ [Cyanobacteriota bacterium]